MKAVGVTAATSADDLSTRLFLRRRPHFLPPTDPTLPYPPSSGFLPRSDRFRHDSPWSFLRFERSFLSTPSYWFCLGSSGVFMDNFVSITGKKIRTYRSKSLRFSSIKRAKWLGTSWRYITARGDVVIDHVIHHDFTSANTCADKLWAGCAVFFF